MSLFTPPSLPGLKGGRKEIRHSTSFADQVAFPGCSVCLLDLKNAVCELRCLSGCKVRLFRRRILGCKADEEFIFYVASFPNFT